MTNVRATQVFGPTNGPLINYIEATVLSLILLCLMGRSSELALGHILSVPWWLYLCSITGLIAMLLQILGTLRTNAVLSSALLIIGKLAMAFTLDYVFYQVFSLKRALGIVLVLLGSTWIERNKFQPASNENAEIAD